MIESPIIAEIIADTTRAAKAGTLLLLIQKRYRELPEELAKAIRAYPDGDQIDRLAETVIDADSLTEFRRRTGL